MNGFTLVFVSAILIDLLVHGWLSLRHVRHVRAHRAAVPPAFASYLPLAAHQKAADYTVAKVRFEDVERCYALALLVGWTLGGGLQGLDTLWRSAGLPELAAGVGFVISSLVLLGLLEVPVSAYGAFVIEQRFGFNRMTPRLFVTDLLTNTLLLVAIGTPLCALVLWLMGHAGEGWWLYVWAAWMGFTLLMTWAYPRFIAPLFNEFRPLPDQALRARIERLLQQVGYSSRGVFVMDGSRRSSHGNAYFTGFGSNKRIVFFDTLLKDLQPEEIESVLAHELGHFKRRHVLKQFGLMAVLSLLGLAALGWLGAKPWFYAGLGIAAPSLPAALILFLLVAPSFGFWLQPLLAALSRRYEHEADDFAAALAGAPTMVNALVKLYNENAATVTPDPLYSSFHDTHPPAAVRIAHLTAAARAV
ncbi:MAG: M48 family metallopeptidase [Gammaproteobacteria bacterium]